MTDAGDVPHLDAKDASGMPIFEPVDKQLSAEHAVPDLELTGGVSAGPTRLQRRALDRKRRNDGPLFSRAPLDDTLPVSDKGQQPMSIAAAKAVIGCVHAQFTARAGTALHIPAKPMRQMSDLPAPLQFTSCR